MDEKKNYLSVIAVVLTVLFFAMVADWVYTCNFNVNLPLQAIISKLAKKAILMRFLFVVLYGLSIWLMPAKVRVKDETTKYTALLATIILGLFVVIGCIGIDIIEKGESDEYT